MTYDETILAAALEYAGRGWRVAPCKPGAKYPALGAWQAEATTDVETIRGWYAGKYKGHGVCIVTGVESGIFVLDIDDADALADLEAEIGRMPDTRTSITGSGGTHLVFEWPAGDVDVRNNQSGKVRPGIDVRGTGGQIVAPPTLHPNGTAYEWDLGSLDDPAPAPQELIELVKVQPAAELEQSPQTSARDVGERPGDLWAARTSWRELLEPDGWTFGFQDRETGEVFWCRPGKNVRDGVSASTGFTANDNLKVWTSSLLHMGLEADGTYSKFRYYSITKHGGNDSAAASTLRELGFKSPESADPWAGILGAGAEPLRARVETAPELDDGPDESEPELVPIAEERTLPVWPVETLPEFMRAHVELTARQLQTPVDLLAQFGVGVLASVCMGHSTVRVASQGWTETTNLYLWCALGSGAGKSPAEKAMVKPLREWERKRRADTNADYRIARARWTALQKRAKEAIENAARLWDDPDVQSKMEDAVRAADGVEPRPYRLTVDDVTPQVLVQLLGHHGRLSIVSAEGGIFDTVAGQFARGSTPAVDVFLKSWSGDPIQRDRVGGDAGAESVEIEHPLVTMAIAIQPSVIERYQSSSPELTGRGFFYRYMPSIPATVQGTRELSIEGVAPTSELEAKAYRDGLFGIADEMARAGMSGGRELVLDPVADRRFVEWYNGVERRTRRGGDLFALAEMISKVRSSVVRLAAVYAVADGHTAHVTDSVLCRALAVGDYWIAHAVEMQRSADPFERFEDETALVAGIVVQWVWRARERRGVVEFSPRDVWRGVNRSSSAINRIEDLAPAFELLQRAGWIRFVQGSPDEIGVRGTVVVCVLTVDAVKAGGVFPTENGTQNGTSCVPFSKNGTQNGTRETDSDANDGTEHSRTAPFVPFSLKGVSESNLSYSPSSPSPSTENGTNGAVLSIEWDDVDDETLAELDEDGS